MCLTTDDRYPNTAKRPKTCYKVVECVLDKKGRRICLKAAIMSGHIYTLDYTYRLSDIAKKYFPMSNRLYTPGNNNTGRPYISIDRGFHSYKRLCDARYDCKEWYNHNNAFAGRHFIVVKCEIPEGAHYWVGNRDCETGYVEFCSDEIRVVGIYDEKTRKWMQQLRP